MTTKYITALITAANDRAYFVPIKHNIGPYFLVKLRGALYVFTLEGARYLVTGDVGSKHARFVIFDTTHYRALDGALVQELAQCLTLNGLPKVDRTLLDLLVLLGRREKAPVRKRERALESVAEAAAGERPFTPTDVDTLLEELDAAAAETPTQENRWPAEAAALGAFLRGLGLKQVVTPVRDLASKLTGDLITTDPSYLGALSSQYLAMDRENRIMTNTPKKSTVSWLKWLMILGLGGAICAMIFAGQQAGWFDGFNMITDIADDIGGAGDAFSAITPGGSLTPGSTAASADCSDAGLAARYPTPWDLKVAVESGAETCKLSGTMEESLKHISPPRVEAVAAPPPPAPSADPDPTGGLADAAEGAVDAMAGVAEAVAP